MDRLLSEQEMQTCFCDFYEHDRQAQRELIENALKAQLAKTDKEWVGWVGENIIELILNFAMTEENKRSLLKLWQERKKEIGQ